MFLGIWSLGFGLCPAICAIDRREWRATGQTQRRAQPSHPARAGRRSGTGSSRMEGRLAKTVWIFECESCDYGSPAALKNPCGFPRAVPSMKTSAGFAGVLVAIASQVSRSSVLSTAKRLGSAPEKRNSNPAA